MSIIYVKQELSKLKAEELLPDFFNTDLLIVLIRELAKLSDDKMSEQEKEEFSPSIRNYIRTLVANQGKEWLSYYDDRANELIPLLCAELYDYLRDELLTRFTNYIMQSLSLHQCFNNVLTQSLSDHKDLAKTY
jgi:uncharacterized membrane protein YheB (UPF0754 family)